MDILIIMNQMLQLFIMIGAGYIIAKTKWFTSDFNQALTKFILNMTMPCMILASVMSSQSPYIGFSDILFSTIILVFFLPIFAYLCLYLVPIKKCKGLYIFMIMYPNVGFMGFPLMQTIFGNESILSTAIINMGFNLSLFTLGKIVINYGENEIFQFHIKNLLSPGVVSSLIAIVLYIFKIYVPKVIIEPITLIGNMTTPLAMIIIGSTLASYNIKDVFLDKKMYLFTLLIDVLIPIIFWPFITLFIQDVVMRGISLIILAMPVANGAVLFAKRYHKDEFVATKAVCISTLTSIFTIPFLVYLFLI